MGYKHSEGDETGEICLAKEDYSYKHSHYPAKGNIVRSPNKVLDFAN